MTALLTDELKCAASSSPDLFRLHGGDEPRDGTARTRGKKILYGETTPSRPHAFPRGFSHAEPGRGRRRSAVHRQAGRRRLTELKTPRPNAPLQKKLSARRSNRTRARTGSRASARAARPRPLLFSNRPTPRLVLRSCSYAIRRRGGTSASI